MNKMLRKLKKAEEAVSPVVATLLLVLVAAGSAVGLSVFLGAFQNDAQDSLDADLASGQVLTIAGSSTVYEFSKYALQGNPALELPAFEDWAAQQGIPVKVQLEKGGSGSGRIGVGNCLVDIGSSSSPFKATELAMWPDCNGDGVQDFGQTMRVQKVATDGVIFAMHGSNDHCAAGHVPALTQAQAYELYYDAVSNGQGSLGTLPDGSAPAVPADSLTAGVVAATWADLPTVPVAGPFVPTTVGAGFCGGTGGTGAGAGTDTVIVFDRQDPGGTSEIASEKLLGKKQNQLEDAGINVVAAQQGDGNQGVLTAVDDHANAEDALFFTSYGYAVGQGLGIAAFGKDAAGMEIPTSNNIKSESYDATRPILYATAGAPSALEQVWLDFVTNPHYNQLIANGVDFEHIY